MAADPLPTKAEALKLLRDANATFHGLLGGLPPRAFTTPGIGGGEWSPKELLAHMAYWELNALEAIDAWERGDPAPIDLALRADGLTAVNRDGLARMSKGSAAQVRERAEEVHGHLIDRMRAMPTRRWNMPPTPRGTRPLGLRIGSILGGPAGPFMHANAHLPDIEGFVQQFAR
jgi:DinB family protein